METMTTIKYRGFELKAAKWENTQDPRGTFYVPASEVSRIAKKITKDLFIKCSVRKSTSGSIDIRFPKATTDKEVQMLEHFIKPFEGSTFDGMTDSEDKVELKTDDGARLLIGAKYIFLQRDWQ